MLAGAELRGIRIAPLVVAGLTSEAEVFASKPAPFRFRDDVIKRRAIWSTMEARPETLGLPPAVDTPFTISGENVFKKLFAPCSFHSYALARLEVNMGGKSPAEAKHRS